MLMLLERLRQAALLRNLEITERGKRRKICKCPPAGRQQLPTWDVVLCPLTNKVTHPAPHLVQINILYVSFLTSNEKRNAGDREGILADFMCYNVCLLPPLPPNATMHHCVRLFSLLCVQASCSNMGPLPDVKVCFTTNTGRVCCNVYVRCGNFFCLSTLFSFFATLLQTVLHRAGLSKCYE